MQRLNNRAYKILLAEVQNCSSNDAIGKTESQIVIKRLETLRQEKGSPATLDELRDTVVDIYPQFSENVLKKAAQANQLPGLLSKIKWATILFTSAASVLWIVNLPYPVIRWNVAKTAPILLLPSFMSMDYHYRGAINSLEQADQLVSKATSPSDIERGGEKVKQAQKHLDNLPLWFLGYYPQAYCNLFGCTWRFTLDEFEEARRRVARLDAIVFQDKNALTPLNQGEKAVVAAKQQYEKATNTKDKEQALALWQNGIDQLDQIPQQTLAGQTAQTKLKAYKRDFDNARVGTFIAAAQEFDLEAQKIKQKQPQTASELWHQAIKHLNQVPIENPHYLKAQKLIATYQGKQKTVVDSRSSKFIEAAKQFALAGAKASQNPPHTASKWEQIEKLWQKAIEQLEKIQVEEPDYLEAQKLLAQYQTNLGIIKTRLEAERESQQILKQANEQIQKLIAYPPSEATQFKSEIQGIINQLKIIKPGTTAYLEAQQLLLSAQNRLKQ